MKKLLASAAVGVLVLLGLAVVASPGSAQEEPPLLAEAEASAVEPREGTRILSVDPCVDPAHPGASDWRTSVTVTESFNDTTRTHSIREHHTGSWGLWVTGTAEELGEHTYSATCRIHESGSTRAYEPVTVTFESDKPTVTGLELATSPTLDKAVQPGTQIDVTSVDPCPGQRARRLASWALFAVNEGTVGERVDGSYMGFEPNEDGSWSVSFTAPSEAGTYGLFVNCLRADTASQWIWQVTGTYVPACVTVTPEEGPTKLCESLPEEPPSGIMPPSSASTAPPATATPQGNRRPTG